MLFIQWMQFLDYPERNLLAVVIGIHCIKICFFSNQLIVDEFVASYENPKSSSAVRKSINVFYYFFHRTAIILWLEMNSEVLLGIKL